MDAFTSSPRTAHCTFSQKVTNAANAGALALIIYNNVADNNWGIQADGPIPVAGISQASGDEIITFTGEHPEDIAVAIRP
ncbi:MAG TPA: hypothetical protein PKH10_12110 [bacterium]|nr:hypothetical protein [bacterium]